MVIVGAGLKAHCFPLDLPRTDGCFVKACPAEALLRPNRLEAGRYLSASTMRSTLVRTMPRYVSPLLPSAPMEPE